MVVVVSALGIAIEFLRRRSLAKWAAEEGGAFEAGPILEGVKVPEAAAFDIGDEKVTYSNVSRFTRDGMGYVVAQRQNFWRDTKSEHRTFSCVVGFVTRPGTTWPPMPATVKEALAANEGWFSGIEHRGEVLRIQAVSRRFGYPHREMLAFARRIVALWQS